MREAKLICLKIIYSFLKNIIYYVVSKKNYIEAKYVKLKHDVGLI